MQEYFAISIANSWVPAFLRYISVSLCLWGEMNL